jgi:hypothetical protein
VVGDPLSIPLTPYYTGAAAAARMAELLGVADPLTRVLLPVLRQMQAARARFTHAAAISNSPGTSAFHEGSHGLRASLGQLGFRTPEQIYRDEDFEQIDVGVHWYTLNLTGVTIHTERGIGISLVRGDENTGLPPPLAPKVERPAGHVARSYLQGQLGSPLPECRFDWHFLVHHLASDKPTAELSLPLIADQNDGVLSWSERIEIDTTSLPPSPPQADSPHQPSTGPADDIARLPLPLAEPKDWSDK